EKEATKFAAEPRTIRAISTAFCEFCTAQGGFRFPQRRSFFHPRRCRNNAGHGEGRLCGSTKVSARLSPEEGHEKSCVGGLLPRGRDYGGWPADSSATLRNPRCCRRVEQATGSATAFGTAGGHQPGEAKNRMPHYVRGACLGAVEAEHC